MSDRLLTRLENARRFLLEDGYTYHAQSLHDAVGEVAALRGALQALVDATEEDWATIVRARAVAVGLLRQSEAKP